MPAKTQNCVSSALEFACLDGGAEHVLARVRDLLTEYSVSDETGMVSLSGFDGSILADYGRECKTKVLLREYALKVLVLMSGSTETGSSARLVRSRMSRCLTGRSGFLR